MEEGSPPADFLRRLFFDGYAFLRFRRIVGLLVFFPPFYGDGRPPSLSAEELCSSRFFLFFLKGKVPAFPFFFRTVKKLFLFFRAQFFAFLVPLFFSAPFSLGIGLKSTFFPFCGLNGPRGSPPLPVTRERPPGWAYRDKLFYRSVMVPATPLPERISFSRNGFLTFLFMPLEYTGSSSRPPWNTAFFLSVSPPFSLPLLLKPFRPFYGDAWEGTQPSSPPPVTPPCRFWGQIGPFSACSTASPPDMSCSFLPHLCCCSRPSTSDFAPTLGKVPYRENSFPFPPKIFRSKQFDPLASGGPRFVTFFFLTFPPCEQALAPPPGVFPRGGLV